MIRDPFRIFLYHLEYVILPRYVGYTVRSA